MLHPSHFMVERLPEISFLGLAGEEAVPHLQQSAGSGAVDPSNDAIHPQQRHGVIAQAPVALRHIRLETIGPSPEVFETPAIPYDRIERSQKAHLTRRIAELAIQSPGRPEIFQPVDNARFKPA